MKQLVDKAYGCLIGGLIGDAMGTPTEFMEPEAIEVKFGWVDDFEGDGTDDSVLKYLLCEALIETTGYATSDDWARVWLKHKQAIFAKKNYFFVSVLQTFRKLDAGYLPRLASLGNLPSSSSAMSIAPVGIINAGHPQAASAQAQELGSLIHTGEVSFCQDGAAAIAAAVAAAFWENATVDTVLEAAITYLKPTSGREIHNLIQRAIDLAKKTKDYKVFRQVYHQEFRRPIMCDSRETIPAALALCYLAQGNVQQAVTYGANFGRDTDTIATMAGAICGTLMGASGFPAAWREKAEANAARNQRKLAEALINVAISKASTEIAAWQTLNKGASQNVPLS